MAGFFYDLYALEYIPLTNGLSFGRSKADKNYPEDTQMSGLHMKIHVEVQSGVEAFFIEDLNSKNRTSVERIELEPFNKMRLLKNMVVEFGERRFIFCDSKTLDILKINEIVSRIESKQVVKLEGKRLLQDIQEKVTKQIDELKKEADGVHKEMDAVDKKIKDEMDKIIQIDSLKNEFIKKQDAERKTYFFGLDEKISVFNAEAKKLKTEKQKLSEKYNSIEDQIDQKGQRLKK